MGFKAHPDIAVLFHLDTFNLIATAEALSLDKVGVLGYGHNFECHQSTLYSS